MNIKKILSIILGIILLNNSIYAIIPLPGIVSTSAMVLAGILLIVGPFINF